MNEDETCAEHFDSAPAAAGLGQVDGSRFLREHNITAGRLRGAGKRARTDIADYVRGYHNTKLREPGDERPPKLVVKLAVGKTRTIQHITFTSYWGPDGKPLSPAQFLEGLFGTPPEFFKNEDELRTLRADPATRKAQLSGGLADKGFGRDPLREMHRLIEAEKSDLFDVLAYVAFALPTETRAARADRAKAHNAVIYGQKQQAFLSFVLDQYVTQGLDQLDADKLTPMLKLRYNALNDAMAELGDEVQVRQAFVGIQLYLYKE